MIMILINYLARIRSNSSIINSHHLQQTLRMYRNIVLDLPFCQNKQATTVNPQYKSKKRNLPLERYIWNISRLNSADIKLLLIFIWALSIILNILHWLYQVSFCFINKTQRQHLNLELHFLCEINTFILRF